MLVFPFRDLFVFHCGKQTVRYQKSKVLEVFFLGLHLVYKVGQLTYMYTLLPRPQRGFWGEIRFKASIGDYSTLNSPLTDTLVSGQLYLRTPFQIAPGQTLYLHISVKRTLSRKRTWTLLKMKIRFFFCLRSLVSGYPMYNN